MISKPICQHAPLRFFMALNMIGWGVLIHTRNPWYLTQHNWLWAAVVVIGGLWILFAALVETYIRRAWSRTWTPVQRGVYKSLTRVAVCGYFFSGAAWAGISVHASYRGTYQEIDFLCPLYMAFLLYLAFSDASKKRKGVESNNEKKRIDGTAALLRGSMDNHSRLYTERVGR